MKNNEDIFFDTSMFFVKKKYIEFLSKKYNLYITDTVGKELKNKEKHSREKIDYFNTITKENAFLSYNSFCTVYYRMITSMMNPASIIDMRKNIREGFYGNLIKNSENNFFLKNKDYLRNEIFKNFKLDVLTSEEKLELKNFKKKIKKDGNFEKNKLLNDAKNMSLILLSLINKDKNNIIFMTKDSDYSTIFFNYLQDFLEDYSLRDILLKKLKEKKEYCVKIKREELINIFNNNSQQFLTGIGIKKEETKAFFAIYEIDPENKKTNIYDFNFTENDLTNFNNFSNGLWCPFEYNDSLDWPFYGFSYQFKQTDFLKKEIKIKIRKTENNCLYNKDYKLHQIECLYAINDNVPSFFSGFIDEKSDWKKWLIFFNFKFILFYIISKFKKINKKREKYIKKFKYYIKKKK